MTDINTIPKLFKNRTTQNPQQNAIGWVSGSKVKYLTNNEYYNEVANLSLALLTLGIKQDSRVSILANTSHYWHLVDVSAICIGATTVPIYTTANTIEVEFILNETESELLFVDTIDQFNKFFEINQTPIHIKYILSLFNPNQKQVEMCLSQNIQLIYYADFILKGLAEKQLSPELFSIKSQVIKEDSIATIIYTSGTTGQSKGALITNKAFTQMLKNLKSSYGTTLNSNDVSLVELPLSHVLGRCSSYLHLPLGVISIFGKGVSSFVDDCSLVKPTIAIGVPRIFEKIYLKIKGKLKNSNPIEQKSYEWASKVSEAYFNKIDQDLSPTTSEIIQKNLAFKLCFQKINHSFGGRIRFFICGGAPLKKEIGLFLRNINLTIMEGYGLTETIGPCVVNPPRKQLPGSVGLPIGDVKVKIASQGEILIQSNALYSGFLKDQKDILDDQGWFHTGDIGRITSEGYLEITDRLKDIIITSTGKNVSPLKIESIMSSLDHVDQFILVGEGRPYLTGIVSINPEDFKDVLEAYGLKKTDSIETFAKKEAVNQLIRKEIQSANLSLPTHEQIKKFKISTLGISLESGHVTPSLKLKRHKILTEFESEIDAMYKES